MRTRFAVSLWLLGAAASCGHDAPARICQDHDGDQRGVGCASGPDCDDTDPNRADQCDDAGPLDCETDPVTTGCPCLRGLREACYAAAAETIGVGRCRAGRAQCLDSLWSVCDGAVLPKVEVCNGEDDDCDGVTDERVQSPCGGCNPDCAGGVWGPPASPFVADSALDVTEFGELTLRREQHSALTLWVPNTDEGTVSKVDVVAASEIARYRTRGKNPIRIAVDHRGDAWVLDGSLAGRAHLTKIAGAPERCRDRNGDGVRTAQRADDVRPLGEDECVLLDLPLGAAGDDARALAVDGALGLDSERAGNVWVGLAGAERLVMLDSTSGAELRSVQLPGFHAYAAAFDAWGVLWLIARDGWLARVDPAHVEPDREASVREVPFACYALEGLSIDAQGRLLLTGFGCESVLAYDPRRDAWRKAQVSLLLSPRGIIALADTGWVAYTSGQIGRVARDPLTIDAALPLSQGGLIPYETIAMAADTRGQLWAISTQGGPDGRGLATRFDPDSARVTAQVPVGMGPRGTGDLSGFALSTEFVREGQATHVFLGCGRDGHDSTANDSNMATQWRNLHVSSLMGADASIEVALRHAAAEEALSSRAFTVLGSVSGDASPFALDLPDGGAVEVRLTLRSPAAIGAPRVARVGLEWNCPGPD